MGCRMISHDIAQKINGYNEYQHRDTYTLGPVMRAFAHLAWELHFHKTYQDEPINIIGAKGSGSTLCAALCTMYPDQFRMFIASHYEEGVNTRLLPYNLVLIDDYVDTGSTIEAINKLIQPKTLKEVVVITKAADFVSSDDLPPIIEIQHLYEIEVLKRCRE